MFEDLWNENRPRLFRFAVRLTRDPEVAEDVVQDTALKACAGFQRFHKGASFFSWLCRIAINVWLDECRRRKAYPVSQLPERFDACVEDDWEATLLLTDLAASVLSELSPIQRATVLAVADGYTKPELAQVFGASENTIGTRVHRVRLFAHQLCADALLN